jgi:hypothetical protein
MISWPPAAAPPLPRQHQWPREMPLDGEPADVTARVEAYDEWLAHSPEVPKLLLTFSPGPGTMLGPEMIAWCAANISRLDIVACGPAGHHAPEDQPDAIAAAIAAWAGKHHLRSGAPARGSCSTGTGENARPPRNRHARHAGRQVTGHESNPPACVRRTRELIMQSYSSAASGMPATPIRSRSMSRRRT